MRAIGRACAAPSCSTRMLLSLYASTAVAPWARSSCRASVSARNSASLLQPVVCVACDSVRRLPSGAVMTAPMPMRPGFGMALPSQ